uniref:HTH CENPB-type domain-containing protein n=1 Tax=Trichuris muris TaxID=70415 RepID=A0A5S6QL60_TRIMR
MTYCPVLDVEAERRLEIYCFVFEVFAVERIGAMSDKRALCSPVVPDSKMRRKSITLETKLEFTSNNCVTPHAATRLTRHRSSIMANMERLLNIWIEDMHQHLKKKFNTSAENEVFSASRGWFERFKKRSGLHSMRITENC